MAAVKDVLLPVLAVRGTCGVSLIQGKDGFNEVQTLFEDDSNKNRSMVFSEDGSHFAFCNGEILKVIDMNSGQTIFQTEKQKTLEMKFSPNNTYLAIWEPYYTTPLNPQGSTNLEIFSVKTNEIVKSVIHKKQDNWRPDWSKDEQICGRCVSNEIQFFTDGDYQKATTKLYLQGVAGLAVSPSIHPYIVAVHVPGKKGAPSCVRLYQYPEFGDGQAISNKSFFKADKVDMMWNKKGSALLVLVSAEVDTTGATYYGEQSLHFMSVKGETNLVSFDKRGPVYSVDWNPNSSQFCVVYGYMPAKAKLFNMKCEPIFDFGTGPRNICAYNPQGNNYKFTKSELFNPTKLFESNLSFVRFFLDYLRALLCLAGFGNLSGFMEMWNVDGKKMICKLQSRDTTYFEWCPDGQHLVVATCAPRLRVSNGFKIWHYGGKELHKYEVPKNTELWQATWQKMPEGSFSVPKIISVSSAVTEVKKEAYRPPSARGTTVKKLTLHDEELPQNQRNEESMSVAALKNKKKREAKAKAKQETTSPLLSQNTNTIEFDTLSSTGDPEKDKKIKTLKKKLKAITDLKAKQKEGKQLEKNQLDKLKTENDLLKELKSLEV